MFYLHFFWLQQQEQSKILPNARACQFAQHQCVKSSCTHFKQGRILEWNFDASDATTKRQSCNTWLLIKKELQNCFHQFLERKLKLLKRIYKNVKQILFSIVIIEHNFLSLKSLNALLLVLSRRPRGMQVRSYRFGIFTNWP